MKIWVHINGVQEGPFELNELPFDRMTPETPVWYEGLEYWMPAGRAELTAPHFRASEEARQESVNAWMGQATGANRLRGAQAAQAAAQTQPTTEDAPSTYLIWSVLLTVLCCNPIGIIPLILGCVVSSKMRNYDYEGARRSSEATAWWLMITIVTSLINIFFTPLMML